MALWSCTQSKRLFYMLFPPPDIWHNSDVWTTFCNPIIFASFRGDVARRGIAHCCCQLLLLSTLPSFFSRFEKSSKTILSSIFLFLDWWWSHQYALHHRDLHFHCKYPTWCPFFPIDSVTLKSNSTRWRWNCNSWIFYEKIRWISNIFNFLSKKKKYVKIKSTILLYFQFSV